MVKEIRVSRWRARDDTIHKTEALAKRYEAVLALGRWSDKHGFHSSQSEASFVVSTIQEEPEEILGIVQRLYDTALALKADLDKPL